MCCLLWCGTEELQDLTSGIDTEELSARMLASGQALLKQFVALHGERLSVMVRRSMPASDWLTRKEPRDCRHVVEAVVEEVRCGWCFVCAVVDGC